MVWEMGETLYRKLTYERRAPRRRVHLRGVPEDGPGEAPRQPKPSATERPEHAT